MNHLLTLSEVATLIGRRPETIRKDIRRKPEAVPPRLCIPGVRQLRWRRADVEAWLNHHVRSAPSGERS